MHSVMPGAAGRGTKPKSRDVALPGEFDRHKPQPEWKQMSISGQVRSPSVHDSGGKKKKKRDSRQFQRGASVAPSQARDLEDRRRRASTEAPTARPAPWGMF